MNRHYYCRCVHGCTQCELLLRGIKEPTETRRPSGYLPASCSQCSQSPCMRNQFPACPLISSGHGSEQEPRLDSFPEQMSIFSITVATQKAKLSFPPGSLSVVINLSMKSSRHLVTNNTEGMKKDA